MTTTLIFIRHGETLWNREHRIQGQIDVPLSDVGKQQAALLKRRIQQRWKITAVYTSDLSRAADTSTILFGGMDMEIVRRAELRERSFGDWEGKAWSEVVERFPTEAIAYLNDPTFTPPGGESWESLTRRVLGEINRIIHIHRGETVAVICHGGPCRIMIADVFGADPRRASRMEIANTSLHILAVHGEDRRFLVLNDTCHLEGCEAVPARLTF